MNKPSPYVKLAQAEFAECRIERIFVRPRLRETIRFSDWRGGRFNKRPLDLTEDELLVLTGDALAAGVFSANFASELHRQLEFIMATHRTPEQNGRLILEVFAHFKSQTGHALRSNNFAAVLLKEGVPAADINSGLQYASEQGWVEPGPNDSIKLTEAGFSKMPD